MIKTIEMDLEFQPYLLNPPATPKQMWDTACSSDGATVNHWNKIWEKNVRDNHKKFGPFSDRSIGKLYNCFKYKPCIVAGSGPSLKKNAEELLNKQDIPLISCLHNFHYFEDKGIDVDFYVTLDAGNVTIEEVSEGGTKDASHYWDKTKGKKLLAFIGSPPELIEKWQGEIYFFNCPVPDDEYNKMVDSVEKFNCFVSTGGNVLGACLNIAKALFGCQVIGFIGADFSFSYTNKFHGWDSKYDKELGYFVNWVDVFGNRVKTWQSYLNFKNWFDYVSLVVPGVFYNCTEGGILGAYRDGNLISIKQTYLKDFIQQWHMNDVMREQCQNPKTDIKQLLF